MFSARLVPDLATLPAWSGGVALFLAKATILLAAGLAITRSMARASAGARHLVWLAVLGILLMMPALTTWTRFEIPVLPPRESAARQVHPTVAPLDAPAARPVLEGRDAFSTPATASAAALEPEAPPIVASARSAMPSVSLVLVIWGAAVLLILCSLAWSSLVVRRIVRRGRALEQTAWRTPLLEVADRLGLRDVPRLVVSGETRMPFACGVFSATIVLPEESAAWPIERRRAVLLHELAHVRRRDLLGHVLGRVVCALYWFHPLVWMAAKRLRAESERACDDLALACGTRATDYAEHLLDIVTAVRTSTTPVVALAMARRQEFEGRMLAILDPDLRRSTPTRRQSAALLASLTLGAALLGAAAPVPRPGTVISPVVSPTVRSSPAPEGKGSVTVGGPQASPSPSSTPRPATQTPRSSNPPARATSIGADAAAAPSHEILPRGLPGAGQGEPDDRAVLLAKVLRSDSSANLRRIAAWGLEQYADDAPAVGALVNAVGHDRDARVREMSAWALGSSTDHQDVTTALGVAVRKDGDDRVRATAAWALGNLGADAAADALTAALSDSSPQVRARAAWALGNAEPKQAPPALIAMLQDRDRETRRLVAWALYQIQDPAALPALESALRTETDEETQLAYIHAISVMGDKAVESIRGLLESSDPRVKSMAVRALAGGRADGPWPWPMPEPRPEP